MLANPAVVADRLASGVLVRPFGNRYVIDSPFTYDLILPVTGNAPSTVQRFIDWLIEEAEGKAPHASSATSSCHRVTSAIPTTLPTTIRQGDSSEFSASFLGILPSVPVSDC